jgi:hypothetical protein
MIINRESGISRRISLSDTEALTQLITSRRDLKETCGYEISKATVKKTLTAVVEGSVASAIVFGAKQNQISPATSHAI